MKAVCSNQLGLVLILMLAACSTSSNPEKGALIGGAIGAGSGALVGHELGHTGTGALVGGAAGATTGAIVGYGEDMDYEETIATQEEMLRRQDEEIRLQDGEILDLKRQKYWNDATRRYDIY